MKRLLLLSLVLLFFAGCESVEDQVFEPEPNILALMRIGNSWKRVRVDQSYDIQDTVNLWGVRGAQVRVRGGGYVYTFLDSFYCPDSAQWFKYTEGNYYEHPFPKLNDTTLYSLEVILPWEDTVTADAYMPSPVRISSPADSDTVSISQEPYDPHIVTWNFCKNTALYLIYCIPDVDTSELGNISPIFSMPSFTMDTSYTFFLERMIAPWDFDMHYVLRVIAVSPEYVDYMGAEVPGGSVSNLSSGYGMFGGIAEDAIRVFIVP